MDATAKDLAQDKRIADLEHGLKSLQAELVILSRHLPAALADRLNKLESDVASTISALAALAPLAKLAGIVDDLHKLTGQK